MKKLLGMILVLALVFSMAACSRGGEYVPTGDALAPEEGGSTPVTRPTDGEEMQDLTLTYYADESMNPILSTNYTNRALFSLLYQSLFVTNRDYQVEPQLCKTYSVSEDMRQYTFTIENATFSDGSPLVLADVLATLEAAKESDYYGGRFTHISTMEISGDNLVITLDTPMEDLPLLLDIPILKANQLDLTHPLGTGPYILNRAESCLERRTDWWCQADLVVTASAIALIPAESTTQIRDTFQFETLDLVCADPGSDNYADYRCDYELWDCENGIFLYLACNSSNTVLSNPKIRSALTFAIDRDKIVDTYYRGFARSATLPASPQFPYYSQSLAEQYAFDESKFAKAVADAGVVGYSVEILVNSSDSLRKGAAPAAVSGRPVFPEFRPVSGPDQTVSQHGSVRLLLHLRRPELRRRGQYHHLRSVPGCPGKPRQFLHPPSEHHGQRLHYPHFVPQLCGVCHPGPAYRADPRPGQRVLLLSGQKHDPGPGRPAHPDGRRANR